MAAALVIAVYLNWQYARSDVPTELPDNAAMVAAEAEDVPVQAQTVLDALLRGAKRAGVKIVTGCEVEKAGRKKRTL